jgi:hypothetical protein
MLDHVRAVQDGEKVARGWISGIFRSCCTNGDVREEIWIGDEVSGGAGDRGGRLSGLKISTSSDEVYKSLTGRHDEEGRSNIHIHLYRTYIHFSLS